MAICEVGGFGAVFFACMTEIVGSGRVGASVSWQLRFKCVFDVFGGVLSFFCDGG